MCIDKLHVVINVVPILGGIQCVSCVSCHRSYSPYFLLFLLSLIITKNTRVNFSFSDVLQLLATRCLEPISWRLPISLHRLLVFSLLQQQQLHQLLNKLFFLLGERRSVCKLKSREGERKFETSLENYAN